MKSQVCRDEDTVSPECSEEQQPRKQVWTSLPPPNMQLLTRKPPRFLSMEELCCGPSADCTKRGSVRDQPQHKSANHGIDLATPLPSAQGAAATGVCGATTDAGSSVGDAGGYGSDLDLFEDEEFDRLCQDVELDYEGSSSDSSLPVVNLTPRGVHIAPAQTVKSKPKAITHLRREVTSEQKPNSRLEASIHPVHQPRHTPVHQPRQGRVLTPETCPMCSMQFPHGCVSQHSDIA